MGDDGQSVIPVDPDLAPDDLGEPARGRARPAAGRPRQRRARPDVLGVVAFGGMLGASARYGVGQWLPTRPGGFPWATFWTNLSGSFLLGLLLVLLLERFPPTRLVRPFLATGLLGAFTTMSTYEVETALLVKNGHPLTALVYGGGSLVAGLALAYTGMLAGRLAPVRHTEARD
jgi:fluoride exporter